MGRREEDPPSDRQTLSPQEISMTTRTSILALAALAAASVTAVAPPRFRPAASMAVAPVASAATRGDRWRLQQRLSPDGQLEPLRWRLQRCPFGLLARAGPVLCAFLSLDAGCDLQRRATRSRRLMRRPTHRRATRSRRLMHRPTHRQATRSLRLIRRPTHRRRS